MDNLQIGLLAALILPIAMWVWPAPFIRWNAWYVRYVAHIMGYDSRTPLKSLTPERPRQMVRVWAILCAILLLALFVLWSKLKP